MNRLLAFFLPRGRHRHCDRDICKTYNRLRDNYVCSLQSDLTELGAMLTLEKIAHESTAQRLILAHQHIEQLEAAVEHRDRVNAELTDQMDHLRLYGAAWGERGSGAVLTEEQATEEMAVPDGNEEGDDDAC